MKSKAALNKMLTRTMPLPLSAEEAEFLWCLTYAITLGQVAAHATYLPIAKKLEPRLYSHLQALAPGFRSPLKQVPS